MKTRRLLATAVCALVIAAGCTEGDGTDTAVAARLDGLQCSGPAASGWCWQQPQPDGLATRDVTFVDANNGWLVGDGGLVMRSSDGGANWSRQSVATQSDMNKVRFVDSRTGWLAAALGGEIWRTNDGGQSWARTGRQPVRVMQRIWALSDRVLVVTGNDGTDSTPDASAVTDDGGQTWRRAALVVESVEADGTLWSNAGRSRSSDLGLTQSGTPPAGWPPNTFLRDVGFGPAGAAWARLDRYDATSQSFQGLLARRTSATGTWTTQPLLAPAADLPHQLLSLSLDTNGLGLGMAWPDPLPSGSDTYTRFARTTDGGLNWQWISLPAAGSLVNHSFIDTRSMQVTIANGSAWSRYLTTDAGQSWRNTLPQTVAPLYDAFRVERDGGDHLLGRTGRVPAEWSRSTDEGTTWRKLPSRHFDLSSISALWVGADGKGIAIDEAGTALDTQDFGRAWAKRTTPLPRPDDVLLRVDGSGWMLTGGQLFRTADGGKTWTTVPTAPGASSVPRRFLYVEGPVLRIEAVAFCGGPSGLQYCLTVLHSSDDAGQTWSVGTQTLREIGAFGAARPTLAFATPEVAVRVVTTFEQRVDRSTDGGRTWSTITLPTLSGFIGRVQFQDASRGWMLGGNGLALRTLDGGITWSLVTLPAPALRNGATTRPALSAVFFANANTGWIIGDDGAVLATSDGGTTWTVQPSGTPYHLKTIFARDAKTVWIGGEHGSIYASTTAGAASQ